MATDPQEETDTIVRYDRPSRVRDNEPPATCEACKELTERVERLEQLLGYDGEYTAPHDVSTLRCYWICVSIHALCAFFLYSSEVLIQFGMMLTIGAMATLVVTQVLSTRPIHERTMRTLLSANLVAFAAIAGLWLGDVAEPSDVIPYVLMLFPPVFASGWIVAKAFVWIRGWKIVPPGYSSKYPKLQIQHLMLCTLLFAFYLAASRMMVDDLKDWFGEEFIMLIAYLCALTVTCTVISCLLSRIFLGASPKSVFSRGLVLAFAASACMTILVSALIAASGESVFSWDVIFALLIYVLPLCIGVFASSGGTFAMMKIANYRFRSRKSESTTPENSPTTASPAALPLA